MPNKCVSCGKIHDDDADYLLKGCDECGGRFFLSVSYSALKNNEIDVDIKTDEVKEIEKDVREILRGKGKDIKDTDVIVLDFETKRISKPGVYHIDLVNLFNSRPIIVKIGDGKYEIDLSDLKRNNNDRTRNI